MSETTKNSLGEWKLSLTAPAHRNAEQRDDRPIKPVFRVAIRYNQVQAKVYTGVAGDKNKGVIEANMSLPIFGAFIELIKDASKPEWPAGKRIAVLNRNFTYPNGKRSEKPEEISKLYVGKNKDGVVYIACVAPEYQNRPMIQFAFTDDEWFALVDADGNSLSEADVSMYLAREYAARMEYLVRQNYHDGFQTKEEIEAAKEANKANRGGGYNKGGGGGYNKGGYNKGGNGGGYNKGGDSGGDKPAAGGGWDDADDGLPF
jgi:hypothetical protein